MNWFQLDPLSLAARAAAAPSTVPTLAASILRGAIGFALVSVAGFAPWALWGRWFHQQLGEVGLYLVCALVFMGLSGMLLHRLILGTGSLMRFYKLFSVAFLGYAVAWMAGWMALRGHAGSLAGLFAGTLVMSLVLTHAFEARAALPAVLLALFGFNALGYFAGGWIEEAMMKTPIAPASGLLRSVLQALPKLQWGLSYGLGLGSGLGIAFYLCQRRARDLLVISQK
jgi:hypothetical protein